MLTESYCAWMVLVEGPVEFCTDDSCEFGYYFFLSGDYFSLLSYYFVLPGNYLFLLLIIFGRPFFRQPLFEYAEHCLRTGCGGILCVTVCPCKCIGCRGP